MVGIRADRLPAQGNCDIKADVRRLRGLAAAGTCHEIADDSDDDRLRYFVVGQVRKILAERERSACGALTLPVGAVDPSTVNFPLEKSSPLSARTAFVKFPFVAV